MGDTQLHLRWHSHGMTFTGMLHDLHMGRSFTDVSLICDGGVVRAHRAVLSLSSPYLATVLGTCSENDEAPLLLPEIPVQDIRFLISFIYRGQVDVPQQYIASFLNTGKHLQILGLEQGDQLVDSPCKSDGSSSVASDPEEASSPHDLHGNNNTGEKREKLNIEENDSKGVFRIEQIMVKTEAKEDIKMEEITIENEPVEEGRIDLNFFLQQAIQSASMPCPLCKKEFKSQSGLRDHIRLHTGERPYVCDFCHMNFARASHLKRHRRMHTGEKPFECSVCGKDFSRGDKLKDHLRRHEAEDKLHKIRNQILHLDDGPEMDSSPSSATVSNNTVPAANNTLANHAANISSLAGMGATSHILMNKLNSQQDNHPPAAKRLCINPKLPLGAMAAHMPQGMNQMPNMLISQSESMVPQMLGVTSIGECILRPIN